MIRTSKLVGAVHYIATREEIWPDPVVSHRSFSSCIDLRYHNTIETDKKKSPSVMLSPMAQNSYWLSLSNCCSYKQELNTSWILAEPSKKSKIEGLALTGCIDEKGFLNYNIIVQDHRWYMKSLRPPARYGAICSTNFFLYSKKLT